MTNSSPSLPQYSSPTLRMQSSDSGIPSAKADTGRDVAKRRVFRPNPCYLTLLELRYSARYRADYVLRWKKYYKKLSSLISVRNGFQHQDSSTIDDLSSQAAYIRIKSQSHCRHLRIASVTGLNFDFKSLNYSEYATDA